MLSIVSSMAVYGAVEMGGTKCLVAFGSSGRELTEPVRIETTTPQTTLSAVKEVLKAQDAAAVGVSCFGPLELDRSSRRFGEILTTPKRGWSGTNVYQTLANGLDMPIVLTTDVNGAALGEGRWGATQRMSSHAYVTVGTGIGAGIVIGGSLLAGERHPEVGHIAVSRLDQDRHPGQCPHHGDCLEGMASGPALEARFGSPANWACNETVLQVVGHYLAQLMVALVYTVAPERIVVGGGVSKLPGFHDHLRRRTGEQLADYPETPDLDLLISSPGLGENSGLAGALVLAMDRAG